MAYCAFIGYKLKYLYCILDCMCNTVYIFYSLEVEKIMFNVTSSNNRYSYFSFFKS